MSALVLLVLASVELTPPPVVEASPVNPVEAPEVMKPEAPLAVGSSLEWNLGAQLSVGLVQGVNGFFLGGAVCGALTCYSGLSLPIVFEMAGALAGIGYALLDREVSLGWGRASLFNSLTVAAALTSVGLLALPALGLASLGQVPGYTILFLTDVALVAGAAVLTRNVAPRAEVVWLADSLGLWGIVMGGSAATLLQADLLSCVLGGAVAGVVTGALLGVSAQRLSIWRFLIANAAALVGSLVLGGGLAIYESLASASAQRPYDPAVPAAGTAAGIAGGFLVGFALSESL